MLENYRLIAETSVCLLYHRTDGSQQPWQRFVLELKRSPIKKRRFQIGWNGERLADNSDIQTARSISTESVVWAEFHLRRLHPKSITEIELLSTKLEIPFLVHFTQYENINSIITHGIHPRGKLRHDILSISNDELRLDGHTDATSVSIAFPNSRMFYKYRQSTPNAGWVILLLDKAILWTRDCAFCRHNAADSRINGIKLSELKTSKAFTEMFTEIPGMESRISQGLKSYDPTDVQAEVLVFNIIPSKLIGAIIFESRNLMESFKKAQSDEIQALCIKSNKFFSDRKHVRSLQF